MVSMAISMQAICPKKWGEEKKNENENNRLMWRFGSHTGSDTAYSVPIYQSNSDITLKNI